MMRVWVKGATLPTAAALVGLPVAAETQLALVVAGYGLTSTAVRVASRLVAAMEV
jgi:hypothetical protein